MTSLLFDDRDQTIPEAHLAVEMAMLRDTVANLASNAVGDEPLILPAIETQKAKTLKQQSPPRPPNLRASPHSRSSMKKHVPEVEDSLKVNHAAPAEPVQLLRGASQNLQMN